MATLVELKARHRNAAVLDGLRAQQQELVSHLDRGLDLIARAQSRGEDDAGLQAHFEELLQQYCETSDQLRAQASPDALRCESCPHRGQPPRYVNGVAILCDTPCEVSHD